MVSKAHRHNHRKGISRPQPALSPFAHLRFNNAKAKVL
jgi:hypothetical protein